MVHFEKDHIGAASVLRLLTPPGKGSGGKHRKFNKQGRPIARMRSEKKEGKKPRD